MVTEMPYVGVSHHGLRMKGMDCLADADELEPLVVRPLHDALTEQWKMDAFMVCYRPIGPIVADPSAPWPRINKTGTALADLRANGSDVVSTCFVYDLDFPGHGASSQELRGAFLADYARAARVLPVMASWSFRYWTRSGARVGFVLAEPIPVDIGAGYYKGFRLAMANAGVAFDPACDDWTRLFRLPYVVRDGVKTWEEDYADVEIRSDRRAVLADLPRSNPGASAPRIPVPATDDPDQPDGDDVHQELWEPSAGGTGERMTRWMREAHHRLRGRECAPCIFESKIIAEEGARDDTIQAYVGQAVSLLQHVPGTTREKIYGLFLPTVEQLIPDGDTADWTKVLWRAVCKYWQAETAKNLTTLATGIERGTDQEIPHETDLGNARRLIALHGSDLHYNGALGWLAFDGRRWVRDESGEAMCRAKTVSAEILAEASRAAAKAAKATSDAEREQHALAAKRLAKFALESENQRRLSAMLAVAQSEPSIYVCVEQLDANPWLLTVTNGTVDLRTGTLREHSRDDRITKLAPVSFDPDARAPLFEKFLGRATADNMAMQEYLQRVVGYCLTGRTDEQCLFLFFGTGANGKTTLIEIVRAMLGDYAAAAQFSTLLAVNGGGHGPRGDVARLQGARLVSAIESRDAGRFDEGLVKQLTGGDAVVAAYKYEDEFEFYPEFKLVLAANQKPMVRGTDNGIWRRIKLVPFRVTIPDHEKDRMLKDRIISEELPGVLAWAVKGCLAWQRDGLREPVDVTAATGAYRDEQDVLGTFIEEKCAKAPDAKINSSELYSAYCSWARMNGEDPWPQKTFSQRLAERGFESKKNDRMVWLGIGLRAGRSGETTSAGPPLPAREGQPPVGRVSQKLPPEISPGSISKEALPTGGSSSRHPVARAGALGTVVAQALDGEIRRQQRTGAGVSRDLLRAREVRDGLRGGRLRPGG